MPKQLRYFNGRCPSNFGGHCHAYICATSKAEAIRIGRKAFGCHFTASEFNNYWNEAWGNQAEAAVGYPDNPGAYLSLNEAFFQYIGGESL